ncbi:MAG: DNA translocase FtsK 4TM domain-containing protein [Pseudomonadota bacterium]
MALFTGESGGTPLVDSTTSLALRRRMTEIWGLGLVTFAVVLGAILWSYHPDDPSLWNATSRDAQNLLGAAGAFIADPLMQFTGFASWGFVMLLGVWGLRCLLHRGVERVWGRLPVMPLALVVAAAFAATHAVGPNWQLSVGLGGLFGDRGARLLLDLIPVGDAQALVLLSLARGALLLVLGGAALGLDKGETSTIWRWLSRSFRDVGGRVLALLGVGARIGAIAAGRGVASGVSTLRERRAASRTRAQKLGPAEPTGSWRQRMPRLPGVAMPKVNRLEARDDLPMGRMTGIADEPPLHAPVARVEPQAQTDQTAPGSTLRNAMQNLMEDDGPMGSPDAPVASPRAEMRSDESVPGSTVSHPTGRAQAKSRRARREQEPMLALDGLEDDAPYDAPPLDILARPIPIQRIQMSDIALEENARMLETVLEDYGVRGEIVAVKPGPVVTLYELEPAPGLKASRVIGLADDIARSMSALAARVSTVPGRSVIGIELPNSDREKVLLRETLEHTSYGDSAYPLALALGKDIEGSPVVANLAKMPHLLIAGTTGSGKSVAINTMILSLLYRLSPKQCRLIMIDPKMLELSVYDNIPHLMSPVVTDPKKAVVALKWVVAEMEERYRKMSKMGVRNIDGYNARVRDAITKGEDFSRTVQTGFDDTTGEPVYETETFEPEEMPLIVVIVDEMADLMMVAGKEIEACIQRLAQMARASGIHLIMATQRPSVDVITGTIKANFPTRISFQVTSKIDSRTILGEQGAEQLLGMGDMLYMAGGGRIRRVHGPFVSDEEVEEVVRHLKTLGPPDYVGAVTEGVDDESQALIDEKLGLAQAGDTGDELYDKAVAVVARDRKCSTSYIQRKLAIGYNKAARLVEEMEEQGVVTPANAVGKRDILIEER